MKLKLVLIDLELSRAQKTLGALALSFVGVAVCTSFATAGVPNSFTAGEVLTAADLNTNFTSLDERTTTLEAGPVWSSYTPTITSDGTPAASTLVRGGTIRYTRIGKTVCLQGHIVIGEQSAGDGGTFIKVSMPPGLPGKAGITQTGIGEVHRTGDTSTDFSGGTAAIEDDKNNFILVKNSAGYWNDAEARSGAGVQWAASGCYETD